MRADNLKQQDERAAAEQAEQARADARKRQVPQIPGMAGVLECRAERTAWVDEEAARLRNRTKLAEENAMAAALRGMAAGN